jgi:hypothetical protein
MKDRAEEKNNGCFVNKNISMNQIGKALVMKEEMLLPLPLPLSATGCCRDI